MSYLIECKNLTAGYEGMPVVKNLSFNVSAGDYLCIVGENGSGKSTLMKTILGLRSALSGEIIFGDGLKQTEIGYLPQQTAAQKDFPATVYCLPVRFVRQENFFSSMNPFPDLTLWLLPKCMR